MFYDTTIWWSDDPDTQRLKTYKQQANHYEHLRDTIQEKLVIVTNFMDRVNDEYTFQSQFQYTDYDDMTSYAYQGKSNTTRKTINRKIQDYEEMKRELTTLQQDADNLYSQYYNLVIREGG